jgi:hypothetical protein
MLADAIAQIENAEELFELLGEPYRADLLKVYRLAILKRFGLALAALEQRQPPVQESERKALYAKALRQVHDGYACGEDVEPMFRPKAKDLVTLRLAPTGNRRAGPTSG